jgi:5-methylcytosine-specific restriction endonuclease McrA
LPTFTCQFSQCSTEFYSKHSTAKYCTRRCAGIASMRKPEVAERQSMRMRKYTNEELIHLLVTQAAALGRTPTTREVKPHVKTYAERFGTYRTAVVLAGLTPTVPLPARYFEADRYTIPLDMRFAVLQRDGFRCQYCGGTPQDGYVLHVDHRIPRSKGGSTTMDNLVTACFLCNVGKSDTTPG